MNGLMESVPIRRRGFTLVAKLSEHSKTQVVIRGWQSIARKLFVGAAAQTGISVCCKFNPELL